MLNSEPSDKSEAKPPLPIAQRLSVPSVTLEYCAPAEEVGHWTGLRAPRLPLLYRILRVGVWIVVAAAMIVAMFRSVHVQ